MAKAVTEKFDEMVLEVETATPGTYAKLCGLVEVEVTRTANVQTTQVPDCDDESKPHEVEREVESLEVTVSATGVWAQSSHETMIAWFYSGASKNVRIGNLKASVGDTEYETGRALLTNLGHARTKGQKVSASINIEFDGTPARSDKV